MCRFVTSRSKPRGAAWSRFSRTGFHCPDCNVELRPITQPAGHILQALMIVVAAGLLLALNAITGHPWLLALAIALGISLILVLALFCSKFGFRYSVAT
jgi:hypothetical protein